MRSSIPRGGVGDSSRKLWRAAGIRVEHTLRTCFIFDSSSPTRASFLPSLSFPRFIFIHASIEPHDISMNLARNRIRVYYSLSFHLPRLYVYIYFDFGWNVYPLGFFHVCIFNFLLGGGEGMSFFTIFLKSRISSGFSSRLRFQRLPSPLFPPFLCYSDRYTRYMYTIAKGQVIEDSWIP